MPIKWENVQQDYTKHNKNAMGLPLATYTTEFLGLWLLLCLVCMA